MSDSNSYGFGGKLFAAIVLALIGGYIWACVEAHRSPLAILSFFSSKEEPEPAKGSAPPKKEPPKTEPVAVKKPEVVKAPEPPPKKAEPVVAPSGPKLYSAIEMSLLFSETDDLLRRGKLFEARDKVFNTSRLMIPQESLSKFTEYETRVGKYHSLLLETTKGGTIEMPKMTQILIKDGGKLIVKVQNETSDSLTYETLTGIRSRIAKSRCEITPLEAVYARVEVNMELKRQADYKGIVLEMEPGKPMVIKEKPGRKATSLQIFDLAYFCARDGANDRLVPLFDEAIARDPDLLNTVHEAKAERMIEVLVYFLANKSMADARRTMDILKERYIDSKAYREHVAGDSEFTAQMDLMFNKRPAPLAKADPRPAPAPATGPKPATPAPAPDEKTPEAPTAPAPAADKPADQGRSGDSDRPGDVTAVAMPDGTAARIADLVARGDKLFNEAMVHLNNCDPRFASDSRGDENKKALKLFMQANSECYIPAQDLYSGVTPPTALLDRVRETTQRAFFCRKFSVSMRK